MLKLGKRKILIICALVLGIGILSFGIVGVSKNYYSSTGASDKEKEMYHTAKKEKQRLDETAGYDPKKIDKKQIREKAQNIAGQYDMSVDDAEKIITQNSIEKKALYLAAENQGISVSDKEVTEEIDKIKATFVADPEGQKELKAEIAGMGVSEEEYWEILRPQYKSNIIVNKYLFSMYEKKCKEEKIDMNSSEYTAKQADWRKQLTEEAIAKYHGTVG